MAQAKRVFILGAGFSKPAGMPLATELIPGLEERVTYKALWDWLRILREELAWLNRGDGQAPDFKLNIEEVFHYAYFHMEAHRLRDQLRTQRVTQELKAQYRGHHCAANIVNQMQDHADTIANWLSCLEDKLHDVIFEKDGEANLVSIYRWARALRDDDAVLTFNYDTLVERALEQRGKKWNHGIGKDANCGIPVFKLHGSIDWIAIYRADPSNLPRKLELLYRVPSATCKDRSREEKEDLLYRYETRKQQKEHFPSRRLSLGGLPKQSVGIAGLGIYKPLHHIPGLAEVWHRAMRTLGEADEIVAVGFSMSEFDAFAQLQFAELVRKRAKEGRPLAVTVIDPYVNKAGVAERFRRVFRWVRPVEKRHEEVDWEALR